MSATYTTPSRPGLFLLSTPHPAAVFDFYRRLAGWDLEQDATSKVGRDQIAVVREGSGGWLPYLDVPDLPAAIARAEAAGGRLADPASAEPAGRAVIVVDPSDTPLGVREAARRADGIPLGDGPIVWIEQKTRDQDAATAFLSQVFGFAVVGARGPGQVRLLRGHDGSSFGGVMQFDDRWAPDYPPHWLLYLRTGDVDRDLETATKHGGSVWFPPVPTPLGRLAYLRDPAGNALAVVEVAAAAETLLAPAAQTGHDAGVS